MTSLSTSEVEEIVNRYDASRCLKKAKALLRVDEGDRGWTLRAHYLDPPEGDFVYDDDEIADRDNTDSLLGLVSALEVVAVATGETPALAPDVSKQLLDFLNDKKVRRFSEVYYPVALPALFRDRLLGKLSDRYVSAVHKEASSRRKRYPTAAHMISFLELDMRRLKNEDLSFFLDLLDDYIFNNVDLYDVLELLEEPSIFKPSVLKKHKKEAQQGLRGLDEFMRFAADYHALIERLRDRPLLRSAVWLHNCYWFGQGGGSIRDTAQELRKHFVKWESRIDDSGVQGLLNARIEQTISILSDLSNWRGHAKPLLEAAGTPLNAWKKNAAADVKRRVEEE